MGLHTGSEVRWGFRVLVLQFGFGTLGEVNSVAREWVVTSVLWRRRPARTRGLRLGPDLVDQVDRKVPYRAGRGLSTTADAAASQRTSRR